MEYKLEVGQVVTMPHSGHGTGGVIVAREERDGAPWYTVRASAGVDIGYAEAALYVKTVAREAAAASTAKRLDEGRAVAQGKAAMWPPGHPAAVELVAPEAAA